jgi:hypothetical protein
MTGRQDIQFYLDNKCNLVWYNALKFIGLTKEVAKQSYG